MNITEFKTHCRQQLAQTFNNTKTGKPNDKHKYRTEGLLQAARLLGMMSTDEVSQMMEEEHQKVFGESVGERQARKASQAELKDTDPDAFYDIPTIDRR